jgi:hypothetical protein
MIVMAMMLLGAGCTGRAADPEGRQGAIVPAAAMAERMPRSPSGDHRTYRELSVPAGTLLRVAIASRLSSEQSKTDDRVRGVLREPVRVNGFGVLPEGALLEGAVLEVERSGKAGGVGRLAFHFTEVAMHGEAHRIDAAPIAYSTKPTRAAAPTPPDLGGTIVLATRGQDLTLPPGTVVTARLVSPLRVRLALQ